MDKQQPERWWPAVGERLILKHNLYGSIRDANDIGNYTVHEAKAGECGTVISTYFVKMDNGIEIYCMGNDFDDPDEQFAERFIRLPKKEGIIPSLHEFREQVAKQQLKLFLKDLKCLLDNGWPPEGNFSFLYRKYPSVKVGIRRATLYLQKESEHGRSSQGH